jgi:REP element-mobilizing transposase RayT
MPRLARGVIPGVAHHVTQRGTRRQTMFFSRSIRPLGDEALLARLEKLAGRVLRPRKRGPRGPWKHKREV